MSDNGLQVVSAEWATFLKDHDIQHLANGAVERLHRVLKSCMQSAILHGKLLNVLSPLLSSKGSGALCCRVFPKHTQGPKVNSRYYLLADSKKWQTSSLAKFHEPASSEVSKSRSSEGQSHCLPASEQLPSNIGPMSTCSLPAHVRRRTCWLKDYVI